MQQVQQDVNKHRTDLCDTKCQKCQKCLKRRSFKLFQTVKLWLILQTSQTSFFNYTKVTHYFELMNMRSISFILIIDSIENRFFRGNTKNIFSFLNWFCVQCRFFRTKMIQNNIRAVFEFEKIIFSGFMSRIVSEKFDRYHVILNIDDCSRPLCKSSHFTQHNLTDFNVFTWQWFDNWFRFYDCSVFLILLSIRCILSIDTSLSALRTFFWT